MVSDRLCQRCPRVTVTAFRSADLIDDYMALSALTKIHVSSQCPESENETHISIRRALFELEIMVDRKQSELEGKVYKRFVSLMSRFADDRRVSGSSSSPISCRARSWTSWGTGS